LREGTRMWPNAGRRQSDSRCAGVLAGIGLFGRERELRGGYMADIEMSVKREIKKTALRTSEVMDRTRNAEKAAKQETRRKTPAVSLFPCLPAFPPSSFHPG